MSVKSGFSSPPVTVQFFTAETKPWSFEPGDTDGSLYYNEVLIDKPADWAPYLASIKKSGQRMTFNLLAAYSLGTFQSESSFGAYYNLHWALTGNYLPPGFIWEFALESYMVPVWEREDGTPFEGDHFAIYNKTLKWELVSGEEFGVTYPLKSNWQLVGGPEGKQAKEIQKSFEERLEWQIPIPPNARSIKGFRVFQTEYVQTVTGTAVIGPEEGIPQDAQLSRSLSIILGEEPFPKLEIATACVPEFIEAEPVVVPSGEIAGTGDMSGRRPKDRPVSGTTV